MTTRLAMVWFPNLPNLVRTQFWTWGSNLEPQLIFNTYNSETPSSLSIPITKTIHFQIWKWHESRHFLLTLTLHMDDWRAQPLSCASTTNSPQQHPNHLIPYTHKCDTNNDPLATPPPHTTTLAEQVHHQPPLFTCHYHHLCNWMPQSHPPPTPTPPLPAISTTFANSIPHYPPSTTFANSIPCCPPSTTFSNLIPRCPLSPPPVPTWSSAAPPWSITWTFHLPNPPAWPLLGTYWSSTARQGLFLFISIYFICWIFTLLWGDKNVNKF